MPYSGVEASEGLAGSWDAALNLVIEVGCGVDAAAEILEGVNIFQLLSLHGDVW